MTYLKQNREAKKLILALFMAIGFVSCKSSQKEDDILVLAERYYKSLDTSDDSAIGALLGDSVVVRECEDDYEEKFSRKDYVEWLKWDSVFEPQYEILEIAQENGVIKAKISKIDKRILLLHEEPIVWNETIRFNDHKIDRVERTKYLVFNDILFLKNRTKLLSWIDENHPELNGFLNGQTEPLGKNYLKAIEFYNNRK